MLGTSPGEFLDQFMPTWCPPTPPLSPGVGDDVYYDDCLDLLYDPDFMGESKLPSVIHELHRPLAKPPSPQKKHTVSATATKENTTAVMNMLNAMPTQSNYSSAAPSPVPFEALTAGYDFCPTTDFADIKTEHYPMGAAVKKEKNRSSRDARVTREVPRAVTPPSPNREEPDYEGPEWSVIEDNAMLEAIMNEEEMKHSFERIRSSLLYNWEYISGYVNRVTGFYRSPRQCSIRYQMAIRPRETGQLYAIDPLTKKQRKVQVSPSELKHLKLGRATTKPQYDHDVGSLMEDKFSQRIKTVRGLAVRNKRPGRQYLDNLPQGVATALLPSNHEHKLNEFGLGLGSRSILLAEDLVRPHEERHFSMNENTRRRSLDRLSDVTLPSGVPSHIGVRRSAIPSQGTMQAKPPYKIEVLSPAPPPRPPPPSNALPLAGQDHVTSLQPVSAGIPRRVASVGGSMSHMVQQPPGSHSYVVVGHDSSQPTMRVQRQEAGGPTQQIFRGLSGQQVRRTPPNTPMTTGITRVGAVNRPIGYVGASGAQGGSYMNSQPSGNAIYTGPSQMASGVARQANRVVRPHNQQRLGFSGIPEGGGYVRTQMSSNQLRVVQSTARPGVPAGRRTVTTARPGQAVTTMVVQGRPGSSMQNIRTVQRAGTMTQGRLMNVVMNPSSQPMRTGQIISGQLPRTAQLLQRGSIANRTGSPNPAVAHVVIAPPSGMQAPLAQPSNSNNSNSHPPNLTPQVSQPMETAPQQQHNEPPAERVPVERVPAERLVPQAPPPQQQPAAPARPPSPSGPSN